VSHAPVRGAHTDEVFVALADPTRRWLLRTLAEDGPLTATNLAARVPISRQAVAKHLSVLREAELVASSRVGREMRFETGRADELRAAQRWIADTSEAWDRRLGRLGKAVEGRSRSVVRGSRSAEK
jgi:DNA-binding transcriptional ArsR family regulator